MKIIMIECGRQKVLESSIPPEGIPAKDIYISPYYQNNKRYAENFLKKS